MVAYFIAEITDVSDPAGMEEYRGVVGAIVEQYGGRYIARGGKTELVEGEPQPGRIVMIEFPSFEQAKAWYDSDEYRHPKSVRGRCSTGRLLFTEGL
jgi:uncharacterized protein (DUF1330 family)